MIAKFVTLFMILTTLSFEVLASNPQIRVCRNTSGQFQSLNVTEPKKDKVGFCKYDNALLDSISMIKLIHYDIISNAVKAFYNTKKITTNTCSDAGAIEITSDNRNDYKISLCFFLEDLSYIEKATLTEGWNSNYNKNLVLILK